MKNIHSIKISIVTLFPDFVLQYTSFGIIARAIARKLLRFGPVDLRAFGIGERKTVDDRPYGGGVGMVLRPDVLYKAITRAKGLGIRAKENTRIILLTPSGKKFVQKDAVRLSKYDHLVFVSGRYEGYDERITKFVDEQLSIGDYVLMGGELPALVITEAVLRHVPGVLGKDESVVGESFSEERVLEYPQYTKPEILEVRMRKKELRTVRTLRVPQVLRSGHHANINVWRKQEAAKRMKKFRPDLLPSDE
ncbi:MAG: tRNA (guanosine(37)-N1)-methyltransferase TrmD [Candidatus Doudnabacteria bacterium]|nr:tRNA (guanosine(37)-N1)-methyltransferase TrmD [Candidatus Doudnabacteria bacterium]